MKVELVRVLSRPQSHAHTSPIQSIAFGMVPYLHASETAIVPLKHTDEDNDATDTGQVCVMSNVCVMYKLGTHSLLMQISLPFPLKQPN